MDHKFVSTKNGLKKMRYSCGGVTYNTVTNHKCLGCGAQVSFDEKYAISHVYETRNGKWVLLNR
jgi:hypothetical protein